MRKLIISLAAAFAASACGGGGGDSGSNNMATGVGSSGNAAAAAVDVPDACTFFAKAELESAIGWELKDGEPQPVPDQSESQCEFERQLGSRTTKSFPNPAIPGSVGFTSVTVSTSPADPEAVAQVRELDPAAFEGVPGLGDDAYFLGPNLLHVRVGSRSFSLRINPEAQSPDDQAKVREVTLALARTGASRL